MSHMSYNTNVLNLRDNLKTEDIINLYRQQHSSQEIKDILGLTLSVRQVQRIIKKAGITRSMSDAFQIAVNKGRVTYHKNPNRIRRHKLPLGTRYKVLERDGFKCVKCGATATESRLEVDHIDEDKNNNPKDLSNYQILCEECNKGKFRANLSVDKYLK